MNKAATLLTVAAALGGDIDGLLADIEATPRLKHNLYNHPTGKKIGRNAPCPCGSGKKFKYCCLRQ